LGLKEIKMPKKMNTGHILQINAIAMDTLGAKLPKILNMLGVEITDQEELDKTIEGYGNEFYNWISDYLQSALPTHEGDLPAEIVEDEEIRNFVYDLLMNFYIARMLLIELNSPYGDTPDPE
jgi:hypothetical protein